MRFPLFLRSGRASRAPNSSVVASRASEPDCAGGQTTRIDVAAVEGFRLELSTRITQFETELGGLFGTFEQVGDSLLANTDRLGAAATKAAAQVVTVSVASEDAARRTDCAAHAIATLSAAIDEVGVKSAQSCGLADDLVEHAQTADATIVELAAVTVEISKITDLIAAIARQTNLLALNATIEAARAGASGRGFAVVAQEVKELAGQTARATEDIASQVARIQRVSANSVTAIHGIVARLGELGSTVAAISGAVEEQAQATKAISQDVMSAALAVGHVEKSLVEIESLANTNTRAVVDLTGTTQAFASSSVAVKERIRSFCKGLAAQLPATP